MGFEHLISCRSVEEHWGAALSGASSCRQGRYAGLPVPTFAHQLRHSTGYYLVNRGCDLRLIQDYLGHTEIQSTVRYTQLASRRFRGLW